MSVLTAVGALQAAARCRPLSTALSRCATAPAACPAQWHIRHEAHPKPPGALARLRQQRRQAAAAAAAGGGSADQQHAADQAAAGQQQQGDEAESILGVTGGQQAHQRRDLHLVLVSPQIPQNAGNVARTCAAVNVGLHLVGPMGFELDSKKLKRAGLDYWPAVCVDVHASWAAFLAFYEQQPGPKKLVGYTKLATQHYAAEGLYPPGSSTWIMLGAETTGLPPEAHAAATHLVKIPMSERYVRSLNLATSAGIGVMEALRQKDGAILPEAAAAAAAAEAQ